MSGTADGAGPGPERNAGPSRRDSRDGATDDEPDDTAGGARGAALPDEQSADRRRRRAAFLRERSEATELRARVHPRRARAERMRRQLRMRTFRW